MKLRPCFCLLLGLILNLTHIQAQEMTARTFQQIDSLFSKWAKSNSPGASIGIYQGGKLRYSQGYGMGNLEYDIPIKPNTPFHVASVSKQFTVFAVMLLQEQGKLSIEDDIRTYLPEIHDFGKTIRIRHLMHHTSGFRDQWQLLAIAGWRLDDVITKDHIMKMILGQRELNFDPGERYMYSNSGYSILARLVEKVAGTNFRDFARKHMFEPLEMYDTHVHDDHERIVPGRAYSYGRAMGLGKLKKEVLSYANDGATSLFTTAEDLSKWIGNMLDPKLGKAFIPEMHKKGLLNTGKEINYGLGLSTGNYKGLAYAGHGGADAGFRSNVRWYPEEDLGIVVLSNLASFNAGNMVNKVSDVLLSDKMELPGENPERKMPETVELSVESLKKFEGKYTIKEYGVNVRIEEKGGQLKSHMEWNGNSFTLLPTGPNSFVAKEDLELTLNFEWKEDKVEKISILDGETQLLAEKYIKYATDQNLLDRFLGKYYCPETKSVYNIVFTEKGLKATHNRHSDISLVQNGDLSFHASAWWMGNVDFFEDEKGKIAGFALNGGRVRNLKFYLTNQETE